MQKSSLNIQFLTGNADDLGHMAEIPVRPMFDERTVEFLGALSKEILRDRRTKEYADVVSYAFWIRKSSLEKVKRDYGKMGERIGRGVAFHIAPSNVPVNFAVSFTSALLAGNACIVRVSNKPFVQVDIIAEAVRRLFEGDFPDMRSYLLLVRYEHSDDVTQYLSSLCDIRIIWGGNQTIHKIRQSSLPPRAIEMAFADRYSLAFIQSDEYLARKEYEKVAEGFYTDTYYTDQNACSSPRMVVWSGRQIEKAKTIFWENLERIVRERYQMAPILAIDKRMALCALSSKFEGVHLEQSDNVICRVAVDQLFPELMNYKMGGGYFFEYEMEKLEELIPILGKSCQTLSYYGWEASEIQSMVFDSGVRGVDRIVPLGHTMDLAFVWDGYHMIETMSRIVYVQ
ncbi:acyl-CoA reductase [Hominifimenecus sp. rT4P-3]|uniref:acyl-CoA reductase n=1 Tax=Hominifimenecus sp. rT4P-3 TaxID=3242979 RepID=UPI003DA63F68